MYSISKIIYYYRRAPPKVLGVFYISHSLGEGQEELLNVVNEMKRKMEDITSNIEGDVYEDDILYENIW